jgi:uncharacterized membrane protein YebE (DUF533 family)
MAASPPKRTFATRSSGDTAKGGDLPAGMKPSGELSSFDRNFREKTVDAVRKARGFSDDREGYRKAEKVVDVLEFSPLGAATAIDDMREDYKRARGTGDYAGFATTAALGALPGRRIPVYKKNQAARLAVQKEIKARKVVPQTEDRASKEVKASQVEIIPPKKKKKQSSGPPTRKGASGGTSYSRSSLEGTKNRQRTEKEANKFGPLAVREEKMPAIQKKNLPAVVSDRRNVATYNKPGELVRYDNRSRAVRTFGSKGAEDKARIVGLSRMGKAAVAGGAMGLGALGYAAYQKAPKSDAAGKTDREPTALKPAGGARMGESTSGYAARKKVGGARPGEKTSGYADRKKRGNNSGTSATPVQARDKSRVAGKMTAFQRMNAQRYEKEGVGGRSMTRAAAQKRAMSEKSGSIKMPSFKGLFSRGAKPVAKSRVSDRKLADFKAKLQGRKK